MLRWLLLLLLLLPCAFALDSSVEGVLVPGGTATVWLYGEEYRVTADLKDGDARFGVTNRMTTGYSIYLSPGDRYSFYRRPSLTFLGELDGLLRFRLDDHGSRSVIDRRFPYGVTLRLDETREYLVNGEPVRFTYRGPDGKAGVVDVAGVEHALPPNARVQFDHYDLKAVFVEDPVIAFELSATNVEPVVAATRCPGCPADSYVVAAGATENDAVLAANVASALRASHGVSVALRTHDQVRALSEGERSSRTVVMLDAGARRATVQAGAEGALDHDAVAAEAQGYLRELGFTVRAGYLVAAAPAPPVARPSAPMQEVPAAPEPVPEESPAPVSPVPEPAPEAPEAVPEPADRPFFLVRAFRWAAGLFS